MKVGKFVLGPVATNCYIGINEETKECFIVDPATCPPWSVMTGLSLPVLRI